MAEVNDQIADFHVRLGRLENLVAKEKTKKNDSTAENLLEFVLALAAMAFCLYGIGLPNHYYQCLFGILAVSCLYHKGTFPVPNNFTEWILLLLNIFISSMLLKIIIGGGEPRPFSWLSYPIIEGGITSFKISWQETHVARWELPLTVIQSFFFIVTMFAGLIGLTFLSSLTSFFLIVLAVPTLIDFNWTFAMPGLIAAFTCFYLQGD